MGKLIIEVDDENFESDYNLNVYKVEKENCLPNKRPEKRIRDYYTLTFILYGAGFLIVDDKKVFLQKGYSYICYAGEEYEFYPSKNDPWTYICIDFFGDNLESLFSVMGFSKEKPYISIPTFDLLVPLMQEMVDSFNRSYLSRLNSSGYFTLILSNLYTEGIKKAGGNHGKSMRFAMLRAILIYINNNFRLPLFPELIAREHYISYRTLMNLFAEELQLSPIQYLNMYRISYACEILKSSKLNVEGIAKMVGISDSRYFSRVFKKIKGVTPTEYRNNPEQDPFLWLKKKNIDFR